MKKILIIVAAVLIAVGGVLFTVSLARSGFNFSKLSSVETETNTYTAEGDFQKISIRTSLSDIVLKKAEDGKLSVLCTETEKTRHTVSVEDGTLTIAQTDARAWTDHLVLFSRALSVTVFLPGEVYDSLTVRCGTGDIVVPESFCFGDVDISSTTGDVRFSSSVSGKLKIETTTGSVVTNDLAAGEMELSVSTGNIEASSVICFGNVSLRVGTGKARLTDLLCLNILSSGSTGEITLKNVNAFQTIDIERSTGDIRFDGADAKEINAKT
ncbi:MAG: DUF4097 family beta strand repeat protein, partial [Clostridia bacterium]|nr:DUF4097 family beta strand repeat protein [Clostridia bacterium]